MISGRSAGKPNLQWIVKFRNRISHGVLASRPLLTCGQVGSFEALKMGGDTSSGTKYGVPMGGGGVEVDRGKKFYIQSTKVRSCIFPNPIRLPN